jgi:drug/metabolite transporter (DMT)-like permease
LLAALSWFGQQGWPAIKIGVMAMPPLWFACWRYLVATVCMFAFAAIQRKVSLPAPNDWSLIVVSGALQMAAYSALTALALTILPPGRASVLAFSTPIWVVPLAAWWLRERASRLTLVGVGSGVLGVLVIVAPSFIVHSTDQAVAYVALVVAAAAWAISIVFVRRHGFTATPLALAPWEMLVSFGILLPLAAIREGMPQSIGASGVAVLAYVGPIATAFAYWAVVEAGRHLPARKMSMALLATPGLGTLMSTLMLGEPFNFSLIAGLLFVAGGIWLVMVDPR